MTDSDTHADNNRLLEPRLFRAPVSTEDQAPTTTRLVRHRKRPEWGAAICAWARRARHAYQFEDGKLRIFPNTHVHLLEPVDRPASEAMSTIRALRAASGLNVARRQLDRGDEVQLSFDQQLLLFKHLYPHGFEDEAWQKDHRGADAPRALKRHRNSVVERAARLLERESLDAMVEEARGETAIERLIELLDSTDLVSKRHVDPLRHMPRLEAQRLATALVELLYGEQSLRHRLDTWSAQIRNSTGKAGTWSLVTAPLALRFPAEHVCVRTSTFREQLKTAGDGAKLSRKFEARHYQRVLTMARDVSDRLAAAGYEPEDMLDIYDFIWVTLRPAARDKLDELTAGPVSSTQLTKQSTDNQDDTAVDAA